MAYRITLACLSLLMLLFVYEPVGAGLSGKHQKSEKAQSKEVVYVCACMKNKSCSCMTEAKMEGPCACGTEGGPGSRKFPPSPFSPGFEGEGESDTFPLADDSRAIHGLAPATRRFVPD